MSRKKPSLPRSDLPEAVLRGSERSPVFWLLYDEYDVLEPRWRGRRIDWRLVCAWAGEKGKRLSNEQPPSRETMRKVWAKVCALKRREALAAENKAAARRATQEPPRLRGKAADLPPPMARPPPPPPSPPAPGTVDPDSEEAALANIAMIKAMIKQRSGL